MATKLIEIEINTITLENLESLAKITGITMGRQFQQSFCFYLGLHTLTQKERRSILSSIAKVIEESNG